MMTILIFIFFVVLDFAAFLTNGLWASHLSQSQEAKVTPAGTTTGKTSGTELLQPSVADGAGQKARTKRCIVLL